MATPLVVTIGASGPTLYPSGTNYATLTAFATWLNAKDLVALDIDITVYVCDNAVITTSDIDLKPAKCDATHRVFIRPAEGKGHMDLDKDYNTALDYGTLGIEWQINNGYGWEVYQGVTLDGLRILFGGTGTSNGIYLSKPSASTLANGIADATMSHCKVKFTSPGLLRANNGAPFALYDNLIFNENGTTTYLVELYNYASALRNTFVGRNAGAGRTIMKSVYGGNIVKDNAFVNCGGVPLTINNAPSTSSNNFTDTTLTSAITGFTYAAGITVNNSTDFRPATGGALIGAASASAQNTKDLRGGSRGPTPDVGASMLTAAALPAKSDATITGITVLGQKVTITGTYTGTADSGTISVAAGSPANGAVAFSGAVSLDTTAKTFTGIFKNVTPGNYATPVAAMTNLGGTGASSGGAPFTVAVPAMPTVSVTNQDNNYNSLTISGNCTGYPTSGTVSINPAATPNGAVAKSGPMVIADDGLTWSCTLSSVSPGNYLAPVVSVSNYTGQANASGTAFTVVAANSMTPGTPFVDLAPYPSTLPAFNSPTIADGSVISDISFDDLSGTGTSNQVFTVGMPFAKGAIKKTDGLTGLIFGQANQNLQFDVKATWDDGSVRHGLISGVVPVMSGGQKNLKMSFARNATPPGFTPITPAQVVSAGVNAVVSLVISGVTYTANLNDALNANTALKTWISGGVCAEFVTEMPLKTSANATHPQLTVIFAVRYYPGQNKAKVDFTVENTNMLGTKADITYDVTLSLGGNNVYTKTGLTHYMHSRWKLTYWFNGAPLIDPKHNVNYVLDTRVAPNYQRNLVFDDAAVTSLSSVPDKLIQKGYPSTPSYGPMTWGLYDRDQSYVGGRPEIGMNTAWSVAWLLSQDKRLKDLGIKQAECFGSFPIHMRDRSTGPGAGRPMSVVNWPYGTIQGGGSDSANPYTGSNEYISQSGTTNPSNGNVSHLPQPAYLPYLLTGDYFYMEEMEFVASFSEAAQNCVWRKYHKGLSITEQVRGMAWMHRSFFQAAALLPDDHPNKAAYRYLINTNISYYDSALTNNPSANPIGYVDVGGYWGNYNLNGGTNNGLSPWMDDFFTQTLGLGVELGFTQAKPLLLWKAKFPVKRMIGTGYCWVEGAPYNLQYCDTQGSARYTDLATMYNKTFPYLVGIQCASQAMYDALTANNQGTYQLGSMTGYPNLPTGYPSNMQPALAYTVDNGYTDADLAWTQFQSRTVKPNYATEPQFSVEPRAVVASVSVTVPGAPTNVVATVNITTVSVSFTPPASDGGAAIIDYTVTASTGQTATGSSSPILLTLPENTTATFTVRARNSAGSGTTSTASNSITTGSTATVPGAPTNLQVTPGNGKVTISFAVPASDGGSAITAYVATASTGQTASATASPIVVTVPNGVPVYFTVHAVNAVGAGQESQPSATVTPLEAVVVHSVAVFPKTAVINGSTALQLTATVDVSGTNATGAVLWSCDLGSVNSSGVYVAPASTSSLQTATVKVTSQENPAIFDTAVITILAIATDPTPTPTPTPDTVRLRNYSGIIRTDTGVAVEGAQVEVFNQATGELATLWKDEAKTLPRHNPIITDSAGYFEFFVEAFQCGYNVSGFGIKTYTRNNIFDIATVANLQPLQDSISLLDQQKANAIDLLNLSAEKASVADLQQLTQSVNNQLAQARTIVNVDKYITSGTGTETDPYIGWDTGIGWTGYTQYDFSDGYYAYNNSPNFGLNFLKLNGKIGTFLLHKGNGIALNVDAGANSEFIVGVEINLRVKGNVGTTGGAFIRACANSKFDITFSKMGGIMLNEVSCVLNKYNIIRTNVGHSTSLPGATLLKSDRRVSSTQCLANEYTLTADNLTGTAIILNDCSNSQFYVGKADLNNGGLYISSTSDGNTFQGLAFTSNETFDIDCHGDYNVFHGIRSSGSANFSGSGNIITAGLYNEINNSGANVFGPLSYGVNKGLFNDANSNTVKRSVINVDTGVVDNDQYPTIKDLKATGKTTLGSDTLNVGNGQIVKTPDGKVGINTTTFVNDAPLQITNPNNTGTAEGLRVFLGSAALGTSAKHTVFNTGGTDVHIVLGNGNVQNLNNSYGAISDINLKENIVPATSKLAEILQVNVVNYNLIGQQEKLIGVISQELEAIFPGMVEEVPQFDEEGNYLGLIKSVKYSVFVPMLIKCVQELQQQIDGLKNV